MRNLFMSILLTLAITGCKERKSLTFKSTTFNFKKMQSGEVTTASYLVKNNSDEDILVEDVSSECDCVVPIKTKMKISSGASDSILVNFEPQLGTTGLQQREIVVRTNQDPYFYRLKLTGIVSKDK